MTNTGDTDGAETVELYASNQDVAYGAYAPDKSLVAFEKVQLAAGESREVELSVEAEDMMLWNTTTDAYEVETGIYTLEAGASSKDIRSSAEISLTGTEFGGLVLTDTVSVYDKAFASSEVTYQEHSKAHTAENLKNDVLTGGYSAVMAKKEGSWVALNQVVLDDITKLEAEVAYDGDGETGIEVRMDAPDGELIAELSFQSTEESVYTVDAVEDYEVHELGYETIEAELAAEVSGTHDLYLVFKGADARIYSLSGK